MMDSEGPAGVRDRPAPVASATPLADPSLRSGQGRGFTRRIPPDFSKIPPPLRGVRDDSDARLTSGDHPAYPRRLVQRTPKVRVAHWDS